MTPPPPSPTLGNSPPSPDAEVPQTPVSPNSQQDSSSQQAAPASPTNNSSAQVKRKPSRRANTAERRATHNAVERQRRETLNGRFLDLAALLPNLSQIRRPSKSSIVNSSIAHIQASRRHRMLAARELRMLKHEADALRRELNEWRDRAGIPRVEEPLRGDAFSMVLSGELEVIAAVPGEEDPEEENDYLGYADEEYPGVMPTQSMPHPTSHHSAVTHPQMDESDDARVASIIKSGHSFPQNISAPPGNNLHLAHILPRPSAAGNQSMLAASSPFDPTGMYDSHHSFAGIPQHQQQSMDADKMAAWYGAQSQQQQILQAQRSLFTPPATSHGLTGSNANGGNVNNTHNGSVSPVNGNPPSNSPSPVTNGNPFNDPTFFARQQGYSSDDGSVGSVGSSGKRVSIPGSVPINISGRGRALSTASRGAHSVGMSGSPGGASPISTGAGSPTYEVDNSAFGRRPAPASWRDEVSVAQHAHGHSLMGIVGMSSGMIMGGMGIGMGNGLVGGGIGTMVPVGGPGGGSGGGFAMMM